MLEKYRHLRRWGYREGGFKLMNPSGGEKEIEAEWQIVAVNTQENTHNQKRVGVDIVLPVFS